MRGAHIPVEDALSHVFGYTVANDVTARDRQSGAHRTARSSMNSGAARRSTPACHWDLSSHHRQNRRSAAPADQHPHQRRIAPVCEHVGHDLELRRTLFTSSPSISRLKPGMVILTGTPAGTAWSVDRDLGGTWQPAEGLVAANALLPPGRRGC